MPPALEPWGLQIASPSEGVINGSLFNNTTVLGENISSSRGLIKWGLICAFFFIFGIGAATYMYVWERINLPENVQKRREKRLLTRKKYGMNTFQNKQEANSGGVVSVKNQIYNCGLHEAISRTIFTLYRKKISEPEVEFYILSALCKNVIVGNVDASVVEELSAGLSSFTVPWYHPSLQHWCPVNVHVTLKGSAGELIVGNVGASVVEKLSAGLSSFTVPWYHPSLQHWCSVNVHVTSERKRWRTETVGNAGASAAEELSLVYQASQFHGIILHFNIGALCMSMLHQKGSVGELEACSGQPPSELKVKEKEEKAVAAIRKEPIQVDQLLQKLRQKKLDKYLNFEVRAIVRNQEDFPCTIALHADNILKNVYEDVISYDHSIVRLMNIHPSENNYINGSYIEGYNGEKEYIATQGPKGKSVEAFWHMVWQENVHCIVMATGLFENAVQQCDKYWGDVRGLSKYVKQGDVHILLQDELVLSKLVIRTFHISKNGCEESRLVKHFEMVGFTDESTDPGFLLDVRRRVSRHMLTVPGPILVHCRCGGGRTAVFIAIDFCLKQLEAEQFVDVYSTVLHMRKFRQNMIRTLAQYRLIYDTLALYVQAWTTVIPSSQLPAVTHRLMLKDPRSNQLGFEKEFQFLQEIVPKIPNGDCASGHRDENRNKSRDIMLLPPERARPYLQTMETNDLGTDFINAVFIDGYHQDSSFISTQWPMQSTINDIWRLLYDFKINSLVVLHENKCTRSFPCFWPKVLDEEVKYGPIGVKYLGCQKYPHIVIRAFSIRKLPNLQYNDMLEALDNGHVLKISGLHLIDVLTKTNESVVVKMFHYTSWHHRDRIPTSTKSFLYMMGCVDEWQAKNNSLHPICVMSRDGCCKSGLYCTLNICCDQLHCEKEVDIFNTARTVKKNRPQLLPTLAEYIYCYSYMSLVVSLMQEDAPKIVVTSPTIIEGEISHGYELLTGFENILGPKPAEQNHDRSGQGTSHNHRNSNALPYDPCDSRSSSCNGMNAVEVNMQSVSESRVVKSKHKVFAQGVPRQNSHSGRHLRENGYLVENDNRHMSVDRGVVVAPKAPGRVWSPDSAIGGNTWGLDTESNSGSVHGWTKGFVRGHGSKQRPLHRQNAEELVDLGSMSDFRLKDLHQSSCL